VYANTSVVFYHTTFAGNLADSANTDAGYGGGLYGPLVGRVHVWNSLFAFNYQGSTANSCAGAGLTSDDYNYFQTTTGCAIGGTATHDVTGGLPPLGPLANNGGATQTRGLLPSSSALDQIPPARCRDQFGAAPVPDQRGVVRPVNGLCDMGAFEGTLGQPMFFTNLVRNGDAEAAAGSLEGASVGTPYWLGDIGEFTAVPYNAPGGFPAVPTDTVPSERGFNFFAGGNAASSTRFQAVDLTAAGAAIDGGGVRYTLSADLGGYLNQADNATFQLTFYNAGNALVGSPVTLGPVTPADRSDQTGFVGVSATASVPVGARFANLTVHMAASVGYNDGYADNLSLVLKPPYALRLPLTLR
jgi:hypothetical protein